MYDRFQENRRIEISVEYAAKLEAKQAQNIEVAKHLIALGSDHAFISRATDWRSNKLMNLGNQKLKIDP